MIRMIQANLTIVLITKYGETSSKPIKKQRLFCDLENKNINKENEKTISFLRSLKRNTKRTRKRIEGMKRRIFVLMTLEI
jgi:hypothetical protein